MTLFEPMFREALAPGRTVLIGVATMEHSASGVDRHMLVNRGGIDSGTHCDFGGMVAGREPATGRDSPRNLPRLATPTPHVRVVLYPEHSWPRPIHWEQYGRRRSHCVLRLAQVKQSSAAPVTTVRLRLRLGGVAEAN